MSDFFANVAARARDPKDVVRPRLPLRFETSGSRPAAVPEGPHEITIEVETPLLAAAPPASAFVRPAGDAAPFGTPGPAAAAPAAEAPVIPAAIVPRPVAPPSPDVAAPVPAAAVPARAVAPAPLPEPSAPGPVSGADGRRVRPPVEAPVEHVVEPRVRDPAARAPAADDAPRRDTARDRATGEPERAPVGSAVRATPEIVPVAARVTREPSTPAILPRVVRAAPERTSPAAPPAAETTIHVSIGRIEVRATQQPGERRRDSAPSAVMSLGEYLSSRAERAR